ncbi:MAG: response regulator transcription factor [Rhodoferax sp.]|nr:response regulator transcription factor [Rhodoferax sp.]
MHILLVDDHEVVRRSLRQLLSEGYPDADIGEAGTVVTAGAQMKRQPWQLMLLDVNLPGASGLEVLAHARLHYPAMAVLVLSAYPEEEFAVTAFKLGAAGYLPKASAAEEMLLAVRCVMSGRRYVSVALAEQLAPIVGNPQANFRHEALSARELEVLRMVAAGRTITRWWTERLRRQVGNPVCHAGSSWVRRCCAASRSRSQRVISSAASGFANR